MLYSLLWLYSEPTPHKRRKKKKKGSLYKTFSNSDTWRLRSYRLLKHQMKRKFWSKVVQGWPLTQSTFIVAVVIDLNPLDQLSSLQFGNYYHRFTSYNFFTLLGSVWFWSLWIYIRCSAIDFLYWRISPIPIMCVWYYWIVAWKC